MHVGRGDGKSKTECMFYPGAGNHSEPDLSPLTVTDDGGFVTFCDKFPYLGSRFAPSLRAGVDVEYRLKKASSAFGALRDCVFANNHISAEAKVKVYNALVLSVLLYGSETWTLLKTDQDKLERFHRRCVRTICNISRWKQWKTHTTSADLERRLGIHSLEHYLQVRLLRWVGHVVRMDYDRLPRKLLFGWVQHRRRVGRPQLTFGHRIHRVIDAALVQAHPDIRRAVFGTSRNVATRGAGRAGRHGTEPLGWVNLAKDRLKWRCLVHAGSGDDRANPNRAPPARSRGGGAGAGGRRRGRRGSGPLRPGPERQAFLDECRLVAQMLREGR